MSDDLDRATISVATEIIVLDLAHSSIATIRVPSNGISYAGLAVEDQLTITTGDKLLSIPLASLSYTTFE